MPRARSKSRKPTPPAKAASPGSVIKGRLRLMNGKWRAIGFGVALLVLTLAAYGPALRAGFIWDDDHHVTANRCIVGPLGFRAIWTTSSAVYYPLVLTSFWIEHAIWGLNPFFFHLVNILMHGMNAVILW